MPLYNHACRPAPTTYQGASARRHRQPTSRRRHAGRRAHRGRRANHVHPSLLASQILASPDGEHRVQRRSPAAYGQLQLDRRRRLRTATEVTRGRSPSTASAGATTLAGPRRATQAASAGSIRRCPRWTAPASPSARRRDMPGAERHRGVPGSLADRLPAMRGPRARSSGLWRSDTSDAADCRGDQYAAVRGITAWRDTGQPSRP